MKLRTFTLVVAAAMVAGASVVVAQPAKKAPRAPCVRNPVKALNLTDEQQEKMKALRLAQAKQMVRLRANLQVAQLELREALGQTSPDPTTVKARVAAVNKARSAIFETQTDYCLKRARVLTPEQRKKMEELKQVARRRAPSGRAMRGGHRGMRRGYGGMWGGPGPCCPYGAVPPAPEAQKK